MTTLSTPDITASMMNVQAAQQKMLKASENIVPEVDRAKLQKKANEFESFYIYQVMELMTPKTDSEFDGGVGEEMFRHNLNEQMAQNITDKGGFGIATIVYKELITQQEKLVSARNAAAATSAYAAPQAQ